jgi:hypothetical protein
MNHKQIQQAFEHWATEGGAWPKAIDRTPSGAYRLAQINHAWTVWQAAWAACEKARS